MARRSDPLAHPVARLKGFMQGTLLGYVAADYIPLRFRPQAASGRYAAQTGSRSSGQITPFGRRVPVLAHYVPAVVTPRRRGHSLDCGD